MLFVAKLSSSPSIQQRQPLSLSLCLMCDWTVFWKSILNGRYENAISTYSRAGCNGWILIAMSPYAIFSHTIPPLPLSLRMLPLICLVTRAAWVNFESSIKCIGASRSFPPPLRCLHYALLVWYIRRANF